MQGAIDTGKVSPEDLETLSLFAEKAGHLGQLSLVDDVMQAMSGTVQWTRGDGWTDSYVGPEGEAVDAFVLTLRLFGQDREPISLRKMSDLYKKLPFESSVSERFEQQRAALNRFLDKETALSIEEGKRLTYREIFDIFVYGSLAHTNNSQKRRIFAELRDGAWFALFQAHFAECLREYVVTLHSMHRTNGEALDQLREAKQETTSEQVPS